MSAAVRHIVEVVVNGEVRQHDLPSESLVRHLNAVPGWAGRVVGPTHNPYWLRDDLTICKKGPK